MENTQDDVDFFGDKLIDKIRIIGNPLCVGLDPYLDKIPPLFRDGPMTPADPRTAKATRSFLMSLIDLLEHKIAIIKPQSAFFERMGWRGAQLLEDITSYAQGKGFLVLMDAKRGDIGSTSDAYAKAWLGKHSPFGANALTVNPWMGLESLLPFIEEANKNKSGVFILLKTSNSGSKDIQDLLVNNTEISVLLVSSHLFAMYVIEACNQLNKKIGRDISLLSFDTNILSTMAPNITVVSQPVKKTNEYFIKIINSKINNLSKNYNYLYKTKLVDNNSVISI